MWIPLILCVKVLHSICNMDTRGLPERFTLSPQALNVQVRQTTCSHVTWAQVVCLICMPEGHRPEGHRPEG